MAPRDAGLEAVCPEFVTRRLIVENWARPSAHDCEPVDRVEFVKRLLTSAVTAALPDSWAGPYNDARASSWIDERCLESEVSLVRVAAGGEPIGLLIVSASESSGPPTGLYIGYLLGEAHWGQGFASELVAGLVAFCKQARVSVLYAGAASDNRASITVLERNGFALDTTDPASGECRYRLCL